MKKPDHLFRVIAISLLLVSMGEWTHLKGAETTGSADSEAHRIRRSMEKHYRNWDRGLFGSRRFYRRELESFLSGSVGEKIATGFDYPLVYPEALTARRFACKFRYGVWLEVRGELSESDLKALAGGEAAGPPRWWRVPLLVSFEGKLKRFRLDDGPPRSVVIVLEDLRPVSSRGAIQGAPAKGPDD